MTMGLTTTTPLETVFSAGIRLCLWSQGTTERSSVRLEHSQASRSRVGRNLNEDSRQVIINGKSFQNGAQVSLGAGVTVSSVIFGSSTTLLAQVSVSAGATPGLRDVTITNPDGRTSTAIGTFNVATDQPPSVAINNLADQQAVSGVVTVSATATDDIGIQKVEFYLDGALATTDTTFPYQFVWDTSASSNAPHTLVAKAYDTAGHTSTAQVTVTIGCITLYSPASLFFPANGGSGSVNIVSPGLCNWQVSTSDVEILLTSTNSGSGNDMVTFFHPDSPSPHLTVQRALLGSSFDKLVYGFHQQRLARADILWMRQQLAQPFSRLRQTLSS